MNKLVLATGLALATAMPATAQDNPTAKAEFVNLAGAKIGTALLTETPQGVLIALEVTGLPAWTGPGNDCTLLNGHSPLIPRHSATTLDVIRHCAARWLS